MAQDGVPELMLLWFYPKLIVDSQKALQVIAEDKTQKLHVIHEAKGILTDLSKKENIIVIKPDASHRGVGGCDSQSIGSWLACHEFEPSTTKDPPCKGAMLIKSVVSSNVLSLVWLFGEGMPAHMSFSSLDHGSKLRGPSPKALV
ncbi:hypothetical protein TNCV_1720371 [Trichonephila clavipes]|nr:hypothetical protein TNCV_1720371 [Trichonephila clavipes]